MATCIRETVVTNSTSGSTTTGIVVSFVMRLRYGMTDPGTAAPLIRKTGFIRAIVLNRGGGKLDAVYQDAALRA